MSDKVIAWLRTVLPGAWTALVTWAVVHFALPEGIGVTLNVFWETVAYPTVLAVVYPILRALEAKLPNWLSRLLMGSAALPTYAPRVAIRGRVEEFGA